MARSDGGPEAQLSPFADDQADDWRDGTSDFDLPHRVAAGVEIRFPGSMGPRLSGIYRYRSGYPFTPGFPIGVDVNAEKVAMINAGLSPIVEPGLPELLADVVGHGHLRATESTREAVDRSDPALLCVGTPGLGNGRLDTRAVEAVAEEIGRAVAGRERYTVVLRSTVLPGTAEGLLTRALRRGAGGDLDGRLGLAVNPEFMREGSSIRDFAAPPMTLVGTAHDGTADAVRALYAGVDAPFVRTAIRSAEMAKYVSNAFHALKICFANEIGDLCEALGADAHDVMRVFLMDRKLNVSEAYLRPGFAFGGSCLPKDLRALAQIAKHHDIEVPMLSSLLVSNRVHIDHAVARILRMGRPRVGMLGLSFKSGTDDLRESPLVMVAKQLLGEGCEVRVFDPEVHLSRLLGANRNYIETHIPHVGSLLCDDIEDMIDPSEVILVGLRHPALESALQARVRPDHHLIDLVNLPNRDLLRCHYEGICW